MSKASARRALHRAMAVMTCVAIVGVGFGFWMAPKRPWQFAHLTTGSFLAAYATEGQCQAARQGFGAGRGIPTDAPMTVSKNYVDLCLDNGSPIGGPAVRMEMEP